MISSALISVGFLLVSTLTAFLRNSLFSPAHFLPNSRESLLCEWALYRTVSVAPVGERDTASVPCVGGTLCSCDSTGSSCTTEPHQGTTVRRSDTVRRIADAVRLPVVTETADL